MFYSLDILSMRKKGKLSRCWLAATLSDRMFKKAISNKIILSIDITVTCEEILKIVNTNSTNKKFRFSLYMSSQLMYGAAKLLKLQITMFQDSLFRVNKDLNPIDMAPKKRKRTSEANAIDYTTLTEARLPVAQAFRDFQLREDLYLLPEAGLEIIGTPNFRDYVESPNFGALTDEELDFMFVNDGDIRTFVSPDSPARTIDESKEQPRSPGHTTELYNLGLSDVVPAIEDGSTTAETSARLLRTPQKRPSTATNLDTPTKRLRRDLRQEIDGAAEDIAADVTIAFPIDVEHQLIEESVELPAKAPSGSTATAPPVQECTVDNTATGDSDFPLDTLFSETLTRPGRSNRVRQVKRVDENIQMPETQFGKTHCGNPKVYTIRSLVPPVPVRQRGISADALLANPSTNRRRHRAADSSRWANKLIFNFKQSTEAPCIVKNDGFMTAEVIRLDAETQSRSAEISTRAGYTTGLEMSENKTADDPIAVELDTVAGPMVPKVPGDVPEAPMDFALEDITNEPMLHSISVAPEEMLPPESKIPSIPPNILENPSEAATVSIGKLPQSDAQTSATTNGQSTSDPNTGDIDAFLPPKLRKKNAEKKTSHEKSSTPEAIVDIRESPASMMSQQSMYSTWTKPELVAYLEILWRDRRNVRLQDLLPLDTTKRIDAAVCFTLLLELSMERKVALRQAAESYATIYIVKMVAAGSRMDWKEA